MAVRVLLLIAVTSLFAVVWESDQPQASASIVAAKRPVSAPRVVSNESDFKYCVIPTELAAGTYRVVDLHGHVGWLTVMREPDRSAVFGTTTRHEPTITQSPQGRWYFIPIANSIEVAKAQAATRILR